MHGVVAGWVGCDGIVDSAATLLGGEVADPIENLSQHFLRRDGLLHPLHLDLDLILRATVDYVRQLAL